MSGEPEADGTGIEDTLALSSTPNVRGEPSEVGKRIGPYRLLQLIGEGGMGDVWLAEQLEPVRRRVAIKVIKAGMDTKQVVARFESERQALALMEHPAIARVLDGGSTPEGRPYFVMEYVAGVSITEHCDTNKLSTEERLELAREVCDGVQHAHQKAIIHRDLKPSNILVGLVDGKAQPKIIDFGIAKATGSRLTEKTLFTELGAVVGTPEYMSPEQAELTGQDVDTRTDVYSLGVILYQLLSGELPFTSKTLRSSGVEELRRQLKEVEPPKPSTKLSTLGDAAESTARNRSTDWGALRRRLQGDLDAITMKAMEKDRRRRYGSPSDLAADLQRHLRHEPVLARAPSSMYRISRYVRRHRLGVAIAVGLALLLVGFSISTAVQARRIAREAAAAEGVAAFLTHLFDVSNPDEARGNTVTARELLDKAAADIDTTLADQPELRARMLGTMAKAYGGLGLFKTAEGLIRRELDAWSAVSGGKREEGIVRAKAELAFALFRLGKFPEATQLARQALEEGQRVLEPSDPTMLAATNSLAVMESMAGHNDAAVSLFKEVYQARRLKLGKTDSKTISAELNLAIALSVAGRPAEAEGTLREVLAALDQASRGPEDPTRLRALASLARVLQVEGKHDDAIVMYRQAVAGTRHALGPEHPDTLTMMNNFAHSLTEMGHAQEGETLARQTLALRERVLGVDHPWTNSTRDVLASALMELGRFSDAELILKQALVSVRKAGPKSAELSETLLMLAEVAGQTSRPDDAFVWLTEAVDSGEDAEPLQKEKYLEPLRSDPRFQSVLARAKAQAKP
ncbi:MAG: protein kinase domain-containing protein [Myxococcaceae bacterium]